jgi:hypothetical protein
MTTLEIQHGHPSALDLQVNPQTAEIDSLLIIEQCFSKEVSSQGVYRGAPLTDAPDGMYFSSDVTTESEVPKMTGMQFLPVEARLGAADSHHGVTFGFIALERAGQERKIVKVAIKTFSANTSAAEREFNNLVEAKKRGFDTYDPLALVKDGDYILLVSGYKDEIHTLDNKDWTISPAAAEEYRREVVPTLHFIADSMAREHAQGLFHGDSLAKNFATNDKGELVVIDLEDTVFAMDADDHVRLINGDCGNIEDSKAYTDVVHFWYGLIHPLEVSSPNVFLEGESRETCMREFEDNLLEPYLRALKRHLEESNPGLYERIDTNKLREAAYDYILRTT